MTKKEQQIRADFNAKLKFEELRRQMEREQNEDLSMREVTRRMARAKNFSGVERELIADAKMKRMLREGR